MHQKLLEAEQAAEQAGKQFVEPSMILVHRRNEERGRYNEPVGQADMAAVFEGEDGLPPTSVNLRVYPTNANGGYRVLKDCNPHRDPMVYPLLFPYGELGNYLK
jgi:hypothetical protein